MRLPQPRVMVAEHLATVHPNRHASALRPRSLHRSGSLVRPACGIDANALAGPEMRSVSSLAAQAKSDRTPSVDHLTPVDNNWLRQEIRMMVQKEGAVAR